MPVGSVPPEGSEATIFQEFALDPLIKPLVLQLSENDFPQARQVVLAPHLKGERIA